MVQKELERWKYLQRLRKKEEHLNKTCGLGIGLVHVLSGGNRIILGLSFQSRKQLYLF